MKKKLKAFLGISLALTMLFPLGIHADESGTIEVTKNISSEYTLDIPRSLELVNEDNSFDISVTGNIAPNEKVTLRGNVTIIMSREGDPDYEGYADVSVVNQWSEAQLSSGLNVKQGHIRFRETKAGMYKGTVNFIVSLDAQPS